MRRIASHVLTALIVVSSAAMADAIPQMINFQGRLTDGSGTPITVATTVEFRMWDMNAGGTEYWMESQLVTPDSDGLFNVLLGAVNPIPDSALAEADAYLGIAIPPEAEMMPRTRLVAVAYAFRPGTVDGASGGHITSKVSIGTANSNTGVSAFVAGDSNTVSGNWATIGGGILNVADGDGAVIGGGGLNTTTNGQLATIAGGVSNTASGNGPTIGGGEENTVTAEYATISGGFQNSVSADYGTIGGGSDNTVSAPSLSSGATIGGGSQNTVKGFGATVAGGVRNSASVRYATVGGGHGNSARGELAVVVGGGGLTIADSNSALGYASAILGGSGNVSSGDSSCIVGGTRNRASGDHASISGGADNRAAMDGAVVGGGAMNNADSLYTTVSGGYNNKAFAHYSAIGGGYGHITLASIAPTIAGGASNIAEGDYATVGGGSHNNANSSFSTISGGLNNEATESAATVGGGVSNRVMAYASTVPGGASNDAMGDYSFAAGRRANAGHAGSFVWGDSFDGDVVSSADNEFTARASGGVRFYSNTALTIGVTLAAGGGAWAPVSDRNVKENIRPVDGAELLERIAQLEISRWNFNSQDPSIEHIGPMAQDFYRLFGVGDNDKTITTVDPDGIALAAIKELSERNAKLEQRVAELTALVARLVSEK